MSPFKSSLARSAGKLFGVFKEADLSLRGATQISRTPPPPPRAEFWEFKVWGAGGGGGSQGPGGGGAYITGQYRISPDTDVVLVVGSRSVHPVGLNVGNYGGGGPKGSSNGYAAGTGGGMSGVFLTSNTVFTSADSPTPAGRIDPSTGASGTVQPGATVTYCLIAAAGGGGCCEYSNGYGGGGGVTTGKDTAGSDPATGGSWNGAGQDTGTGGTSDSNTPGGLFYGGHSNGGGGGGGGFYGGGGGGNSSAVSGGAGGASYYKTSTPGPPAYLGYNPGSHSASADGNSGTGPNAGHAGNRSDPLNNGSYGSGAVNAEGQNGFIAYRRALSYPELPAASWTNVTHVGTDQSIDTGPGI